MFESKINIKAPSKLLEAYYNALLPEQEFKTGRSEYIVKKSRGALIVTITASDATAFRAVMNSITGLIALVEKNWRLRNK